MVPTQLPGIHNQDILIAIFSFLPILDLARCAAVCKQWHEVVMGSTLIWKGKRYNSRIGLRISAEMSAILCALPLLHRAVVEVGHNCILNFYYPSLHLTVRGISDLRAVWDWQKLRCTYLSVQLTIAKFFFSSHSPIDFSVLQKLDITKHFPVLPFNQPGTRAECAISCALQLCPNLRRLRLHDCDIEEGDLDVTAPGLRSLVSLELSICDISDLSFLRHCERLQEFSVVIRRKMETGKLLMGLGHLPASVRSLCLTGSAATAHELSEALPCLPSLDQLSLSCAELDCLDFLHGWTQLRHLCLYYSRCPDKSQLLKLCHLSQLETLDLSGHKDDLAVLSSVIPSLPHLDTLSVEYGPDVDYILQEFPRFRSLSLFDEAGNLYDMNKSGILNFSICGGKYVCKFIREVV